ncbi:Asp23/Gls24 family envelope stress response protein [Microbacterium sp. KSW2-21]|uniref:Asp23/Gls24 family envelope stress response protein n=1 Tax=Microbacterium algihabitans TaxID=3075992 RepID=A0ABU3S086_9MICO|nr:Asp23/Gls24 family envelope stress response protein [Microbacterium sp. KSW2-21]MDU0328474.1 Asp23/Gls24 family envelope stress response protein [Microbacterium sp. KSW2-21]
MTDTHPAPACGHTLDSLSVYLAHDRIPYNPLIEECPECQNALRALTRVSYLSRKLIEDDARRLPDPPASWLDNIFAHISTEARAGRNLPLHHPDPAVTLSITEGAVRALIRDVGDGIPGLIIGSSRLRGDAELPRAGICVELTVSVAAHTPMPPLLAQLRQDVSSALAEHTELTVDAIDITVQNVHVPAPEKEPS